MTPKRFVTLPDGECCICGARSGLRCLSAYADDGHGQRYVGSGWFCREHDTAEWHRVGEKLINGEAIKRRGVSELPQGVGA